MKNFKQFKSKIKNPVTSDKTNEEIFPSLEKNIDILKALFKDCSDIVFRPFTAGGHKAYLLFVDGFIDAESIQFHTLHQILIEAGPNNLNPEYLKKKIISVSSIKETGKLDEVVSNVLMGNTVILIDELTKALLVDAKGGARRGVAEPETESAIRGPKEGFTETLRTNTSLLRRKVRSNRLKMISKEIGQETATNIAVAYIEGLAPPELVEEVLGRLDQIKIDGILESGYIEELIQDNFWTIFPQIQNTERPDTVAANLLEGRVAVFTDGTPFVLIMPATFWQFLQASEDYYHRFHISIFLRILRIAFIFFALELPSIYVALTTYHQEMIPTNLLFTIAASREAIPFPAFVEAMIMELSFEALREAGVRLPKIVGQAVSILGALVIGQAAVQAGIVSAPMVIVVSITGIASFTIPRFNMAISIRLLRFALMILAGMFGLYGIVIGSFIILSHLCKLKSFGVPYFWPVAPLSLKGLKDVFVRVPWWAMDQRPDQMIKKDVRRQSDLKTNAPKVSEEGSPS